MHDLRRWGETGGDAGKAGYLLVKVDTCCTVQGIRKRRVGGKREPGARGSEGDGDERSLAGSRSENKRVHSVSWRLDALHVWQGLAPSLHPKIVGE